MADTNDLSQVLCDQVTQAYKKQTPLAIKTGNSKAFYGHEVDGEALSLREHSGILNYKASELVVTARSGTRISELENALEQHGQQLAFEPPCHSDNTTIGGAIACGLSGPARPFTGSARDFVLGTKVINGKGELLQFGGQVMKNVAGYDVSRLMVGAQGTLGVLTEVSLKVLPRAEAELTLQLETNITSAHQQMREWIKQGHPITASCYYKGLLSLRLSSTENSIKAARASIGGETGDSTLWQQLRHQTHPFFQQQNLWRLSVPAATPLHDEDDQLVEWGGALRWKTSNNDLFEQAARLNGHATRYNIAGKVEGGIFQPMQAGMLAIHQRIKTAMDPCGILNPKRLYTEL